MNAILEALKILEYAVLPARWSSRSLQVREVFLLPIRVKVDCNSHIHFLNFFLFSWLILSFSVNIFLAPFMLNPKKLDAQCVNKYSSSSALFYWRFSSCGPSWTGLFYLWLLFHRENPHAHDCAVILLLTFPRPIPRESSQTPHLWCQA
jgi:hypothetical protein